MEHLSSAGPQAFSLRVLKEIGRSRGLLSDKAIAHALGVRRMALRPTLVGLQASGLVQASPSLECTLFVVTQRGLDAIRASQLPDGPAAMEGPVQDDVEPSPGMRR
ncbi:MAG: hypothetical protein DI532_12455 [Azospirillum brasilense]|nr:MAG: hypothetical protein DI532_12455 [Azospirillum brasilense]